MPLNPNQWMWITALGKEKTEMAAKTVVTGAGGGTVPGQTGIFPGGEALLNFGAGILTDVATEFLTGGNGSNGNINQVPQSGCTPADKRFKIDPCTGQLVEVKKRRRRRRLLSCSDKADIAFVTGTLGKGSLASTAISSLLARCG